SWHLIEFPGKAENASPRPLCPLCPLCPS
ncbi:unnamed protein product, partial [Rotaria sp. Silwood2]